jgi:cyclophilin family peptidyl-prolyl cis-trans isomerase
LPFSTPQGDPAVQKQWKEIILEDDPVLHTNDRATVSFATSGPNTRTTQLFINTKTDGNAFLDKQGFSPFAEIVNGMEYVDHIYAEYGEKPSQGKITKQGNAYLQEKYPLLSYVKHIYEEEKEDTEEAT